MHFETVVDFQIFFSILQKERDLELAARIGQSLLKKNRVLSEQNEYLEEQVGTIREEVLEQIHYKGYSGGNS